MTATYTVTNFLFYVLPNIEKSGKYSTTQQQQCRQYRRQELLIDDNIFNFCYFKIKQ